MTAHRLTSTKGFLLCACLVAAVLCIHAYALHLDEEAQANLRAHTAYKQA
ncbi:hypothetical protein RSP673_012525 [Ralstonia solanacearum P673]|nr:hypothetical protein [Ralstonia solanacearum]MCL9852076.1 hypothetical protein [Ralstonia solanacearum]MCL9856978.1 hypothetical protein [Ralstonia solanacearum]MCL9859737.1 hypothetical protein [Ralstonia solanacearum]MCL9866583.1 hypothetical protein [Ralstonia solanacearum]MCL9871370.1 hypothetical protein [Ralstonia solanacearum]